MDEIELAVIGCSGMINAEASVMKDLVELTRGLRDRLTDTQINLRPIAARTVGSMLASVDKSCQAKLGKIVFAPLINLAMNDIKKPLRDASLDAIRAGVTATELDGGGVNELALENFVGALVSEVNESAIRVSPNLASMHDLIMCPVFELTPYFFCGRLVVFPKFCCCFSLLWSNCRIWTQLLRRRDSRSARSSPL